MISNKEKAGIVANLMQEEILLRHLESEYLFIRVGNVHSDDYIRVQNKKHIFSLIASVKQEIEELNKKLEQL
jgi:hypothetical protein